MKLLILISLFVEELVSSYRLVPMYNTYMYLAGLNFICVNSHLVVNMGMHLRTDVQYNAQNSDKSLIQEQLLLCKSCKMNSHARKLKFTQSL